MLITKKTNESDSTFVPGVNFLRLTQKLLRQFGDRAFALLVRKDRGLADAASDFVRYLIKSSEPRDLLHFATLHDQEVLHNTLREFITLHTEGPDIPAASKAEFNEIAAQLLTQAYCIYHEPNNLTHRNNYWAYWLSIDLARIFRPFEIAATQSRIAFSPALGGSVYEE